MARINPQLREPTYEEVVVGELIGPYRVVADAHYMRRACFALGQYAPEYHGGTGSLVPAAMIGRDLVALFCEIYDPSRIVGLHQKEEIWFHAPIPLGTVMEYTGRYTGKYERRGKGYTVLDCEARDAATGRLLVRQISTEIMRVPQGITLGTASAPHDPAEPRVAGIWPSDRTPVARAGRDLPPGTPIMPLTKAARQDQMTMFSGGARQWYNIHTDIEVALQAGFRDTLAQGMMETCWVSQMLEDFAGAGWRSSGWSRMAYLKPVFRDDEVTCRAVISSAEPADGGTKYGFETWVENTRGEMTAAGWASCMVR